MDAERPSVERLHEAVLDVARFIASINNRGVFIGGFAVSMWTEGRFTQDIDATIDQDSLTLERIGATIEPFDLTARIPNAAEFAA